MLVMHLLTTWMHIVVFVLCLNSGYKILTNSRAIGEDVQKFVYKVGPILGQAQEEKFAVSITFYSSTSKNISNISDANSPFDENKQYNVLFHGYNASPTNNTPYFKPMIEAYLQIGHNVLALDYGSVVTDNLYFPILPRVPGLGKQIGSTILEFAVKNQIPLENFHFVAHSLGAHIAAYAAQHILNTSKSLIGRITGMDPAGPGYQFRSLDQRLSKDDALFVDIIHSNEGEAGYVGPIGHVDFYPNGGTVQNGCSINPVDDCSHGRSLLYFAESILNNNFLATKCESYLLYRIGHCNNNDHCYMGEYSNLNTFRCSGKFYLKTNNNSPYAIGDV